MAKIDLRKYGITGATEVVYNPSYDELFREETKKGLRGFEKGQLTEMDAVNVMTGVYTGRSPKDKFFVMDETTKDTIWWTSDEYKNDNKPVTKKTWKELKKLAGQELSNKKLYVVDTFCGANENTRLKIRFIMEVAWQAHFVKNMFIRPTDAELENYGEPDFVVLNASKAKVKNFKELGLNSETAVVFNLTEKMQVIINTWYGGEMKKGMFSYMNYLLPLKGIASMHCSANTNEKGETAIFFGLSGTGKTTLTTDPKRQLIGDDEHGWDDDGVFNFEGGCYAKVINLSQENEPDIWNAIRRNALLENVTVDKKGNIDFADKSVTENTRVSYPIFHIDNIVKPVSKAPAARKVIFLSADAFGVLPPVSILTPEQTKYYFLSGFTAKLAGTERGITEPTPTFSACFGAAFLSLHPTKYGEELVKRMQKSGATAYLVNTGWNGTGKRISIKDTRGIIDAILDGSIDKAPTKQIPIFDFKVPTELPGVNPAILDPRDTYSDAAQWDEKAKDLAGRFIKNFVKFTGNDEGKSLLPPARSSNLPQSIISRGEPQRSAPADLYRMLLPGIAFGTDKKPRPDPQGPASLCLVVRQRLFLLGDHALLLDAGLLTRQVAQIVDACAAYDTHLVQLDFLDVGRVERENALDAHAVRNLADGEHLGLAGTLDLDYDTTETLKALLAALDDFVGHGDSVTGLERRDFGLGLGPQLLVDELDDCIFVHCCNKFIDFALNIPAASGLPYAAPAA